MWRWIIVGFIMFIMFTPVLGSQTYVGATSDGLVILTTNNEADLAVAYNVAALLNAKVIVSPWGTYDPKVSAEILSARPDRVIIIGGPVAVPEDYTADLSGFGISYERWYGETRYGTNLQVVEHLREEFPEVLNDVRTVVVINGRDGLALKSYTDELLIGTGAPSLLILTGSGKVEETMKALDELGKIEKLVYLGTTKNGKPLLPLNKEWLSDFARGRFGSQLAVEEKAISPGPIELGELIEEVSNKTSEAGKLLDGLQIPSARKRLQDAKSFLKMAMDAYSLGDYYRAYEMIMRASWNADFVIASAYREMMTVYQGSAALMLRRKLTRFQVMVEFLKMQGYNVSDAEALLQQALNALNQGNYSEVLNDLLPQIKRELAMEVRMGRVKLRHAENGVPSGSNGHGSSHGGRNGRP